MNKETATQSRYSAHRGLTRWCVWDNKVGQRVGPWREQMEAMLEASKLNDAERKGK